MGARRGVKLQRKMEVSMFRKCLNTYFLLDISINSTRFEMMDIALEFPFRVIHVLLSVYVLD